MSSPSFRLLDLPAELRCMIYEEINIVESKYELKKSDANCPTWKSNPLYDSTITMYRNTLSTSILATCRLIHQEATPILARKLRKMLHDPLRFVLDWHAAEVIFSPESALYACFGTYIGSDPLPTNDHIEAFCKSCFSYLNGHLRSTTRTATAIELTIVNPLVQPLLGAEVIRAVLSAGIWSENLGFPVAVVYNRLPDISFHGTITPARWADRLLDDSIQTLISRNAFTRCNVRLRNLGDIEWASHREALGNYEIDQR